MLGKYISHVVGVRVSDKRPNHVIQRVDNTVTTPAGALKGIGKVVRFLNLEMTTESHPAGNHDDQDDDQLDHAEEVLQPQAPFQRKCVHKESGGDARQTDTALVPSVDLDLRRVEDVLAEDDAVARGPAKEHSVGSKHGRGEELGLGVNVLQVVLFAAIPGKEHEG